MKAATIRASLIFVISLMFASTPTASPTTELLTQSDELTASTAEWASTCSENSGWGPQGNQLFCFSVWNSIEIANKDLASI